MNRSPAIPYIAPFCLFIAFLALRSVVVLPTAVDEFVRIAVVGLAILMVSRPVLDFRISRVAGSLLMGVLIFGIWVAPDLLFASYRQSALFNNFLTGHAASSVSTSARGDAVTLALRTVRTVLIVPIAEELFWRGWLVRWFMNPDFLRVPLGEMNLFGFFATALLFAAEHGSYWDVGLLSGILFNLWMIRAKSLGDLIFSHAVANACLSAYVIIAGKWEYWL